VRIELEVLWRASLSLFVRKVWAEGGKHASPLLLGHLLAGVAAPRNLRDLVASDTAEAIDHPRRVPACKSRLDDEPGRMSGMAGAVEQHDRCAHRVSEDDRPLYPERLAEDADVVRAGLEAPRGCVAPLRSPVSTQIEVDNLGMLREPSEVRLEVRVVVDPGATVNQHHRRSLPQLAPVGHECRPVDVEPQSRPIRVDLHPGHPFRRERLLRS
jgi:hypothetical protein